MNKWKHQIFFSPIVPIGGVPMEKLAAYSSSKAALTMFSAVMRQELSKWGVKVSVIQPGGFRTSRCLRPRAVQYSFWKGCWRSFVLTEFKPNPSVVDQRGVGMGGLLLSIEGQVPGFAVYGCSPAAFHQGIKFWCYVFFKHNLLPSEGHDPHPSTPGGDGHPLLSAPWISGLWADVDDPHGSVLSSGSSTM